jgi:hypothetical protein
MREVCLQNIRIDKEIKRAIHDQDEADAMLSSEAEEVRTD